VDVVLNAQLVQKHLGTLSGWVISIPVMKPTGWSSAS
jgi:hypothetical protein